MSAAVTAAPVTDAERSMSSGTRRGRLICFEGLDGAGKTTTAALTARALADRREPSAFIEKKCTRLADPRLADRMARLKALIWDYGETPIFDLGDEHSLYIMASWFAAFDRCLVRPALEAGTTVVVDNWYYKFLARFRLKPSVDFDLVLRVFGGLSPVDHVIYLDIPAARAADRKATFTQAETGNLDGLSGMTRENFVSYQESVRSVLLDFAVERAWLTVPVDCRPPAEITASVMKMLPARSRDSVTP